MGRKVKSTVVLNMLRLRQLDDAVVRALEKTGEALLSEIKNAEIIPYDIGALHDKTYLDKTDSNEGNVSIVSEGPYARRLYYHPEYNFQTYEHAFAQGKWFEPWLKGGISEDFAKKAFAEILRKEGNL